ncbi:uncharacterized protein LOC142140099 [Mixophyes fleayi]|uniref:uncharacterized protein LOC142140099 n=1 Tax=Mixophyes fleayi TaxID=3061075 RepID=UPI003F4E269D
MYFYAGSAASSTKPTCRRRDGDTRLYIAKSDSEDSLSEQTFWKNRTGQFQQSDLSSSREKDSSISTAPSVNTLHWGNEKMKRPKIKAEVCPAAMVNEGNGQKRFSGRQFTQGHRAPFSPKFYAVVVRQRVVLCSDTSSSGSQHAHLSCGVDGYSIRTNHPWDPAMRQKTHGAKTSKNNLPPIVPPNSQRKEVISEACAALKSRRSKMEETLQSRVGVRYHKKEVPNGRPQRLPKINTAQKY